MTRKELLEEICPSDYINCCTDENIGCCCDDCKQLMNEWLDEYDKQIRKDYAKEIALNFDEMDKTAYRMGRADGIAQGEFDGRVEAIDEFAEEIKNLIYKWFEKGVINTSQIDKIAEQLKENK